MAGNYRSTGSNVVVRVAGAVTAKGKAKTQKVKQDYTHKQSLEKTKARTKGKQAVIRTRETQKQATERKKADQKIRVAKEIEKIRQGRKKGGANTGKKRVAPTKKW